MYGNWSSEHIADCYFPSTVSNRRELTSSSGVSDREGSKKAEKFNMDFVSDDPHEIFDDYTEIIDLSHASFLYDDALHSVIAIQEL